MPFVPVPKDLTKVKTKVALNLTKRQIVCFGLGGIAGIPAYLFTRGGIGNEAAALLMITLMLPFFAFGIYEKDGQPLEKVIRNFLNVMFLRPPERPYRTNNAYAALMRQAEYDREAEKFETENKNKTAGRAGKETCRCTEPVQKRQGGVKPGKPHAGREALKTGEKTPCGFDKKGEA